MTTHCNGARRDREPELKRVMGPKLLLLFIVGDILGAGVYAVTGQMAGDRRRHRLAAVPGRLRRRDPDRAVLPRAGHQVPAGRRRRALHAQGVRHPLRHVPGRLRGGLLGHHQRLDLGQRAGPEPHRRARGQRLDGRRAGTGPITADRDGLHGAAGADQPARRRREREVQRGPHPGRDDRAGHRHRRRLLRDGPGRRRPGRAHRLRRPQDKGMFLAVTAATSIAFFAMVGFEDSVNMVEETKDPERIFPRTMLTGLGIAVIIYMLVAISVVSVLTPDELDDDRRRGGPGPARGGQQGRAGLPDRQGLPVPRGLRRRQHRADQHADGQPAALRHGQPGRAAPHRWARCSPGTPHAVRRDRVLHACSRSGLISTSPMAPRATWSSTWRHHGAPAALRVHRRQRGLPGAARAPRTTDVAFRSPGPTPIARRRVLCAFLAGPWVDRDVVQYKIAGGLLADRHRALGDHLARSTGPPGPRTRLRRRLELDG